MMRSSMLLALGVGALLAASASGHAQDGDVDGRDFLVWRKSGGAKATGAITGSPPGGKAKVGKGLKGSASPAAGPKGQSGKIILWGK